MQQLMIMVTEVGKLEHTCNLLAEVNKGGKVIKFLTTTGINYQSTLMEP